MRSEGNGAGNEKSILFVSDVHLAPHLPDLIRQFSRFLESACKPASALYILGDLFDFWVGPKNARVPEFAPVFDGLRRLAEAGLAVTFVPGNRDFQLDPAFGRSLGLAVTGDFYEIRLDGRRALLHHGDLFCTRDRGYQALRRVVRHPAVRVAVRTLPLRLSVALARAVRRLSDRAVERKTSEERGICTEAVVEWLRRGIGVIVCGHVHEAATREVASDGRTMTLVTLGSFDEGGQFASYAGGAFRHERFSG